MLLHEKLVELRKFKKLSRRKAALKTGVNENSIYLYEIGRFTPSLEVLQSLANTYEVDVGDLARLPVPARQRPAGNRKGRFPRPEVPVV